MKAGRDPLDIALEGGALDGGGMVVPGSPGGGALKGTATGEIEASASCQLGDSSEIEASAKEKSSSLLEFRGSSSLFRYTAPSLPGTGRRLALLAALAACFSCGDGWRASQISSLLLHAACMRWRKAKRRRCLFSFSDPSASDSLFFLARWCLPKMVSFSKGLWRICLCSMASELQNME